MKLKVPPNLTRVEAWVALQLLELAIDTLIAFYHEFARVYDILHPEHDEDLPF